MLFYHKTKKWSPVRFPLYGLKTMEMTSEKKIKLSPDLKQFLADEVLILILMTFCIMMTGYEDDVIKKCCMILTGLLAAYLFGRLWYYKSVKWEITRTQIKITKGVLIKQINYIELYRIIDYAEQQTFIQQLIGLKDVYILSSDRTEPALRIFGIANHIDIINEIKPLVKQSRIDNHIYEIANN